MAVTAALARQEPGSVDNKQGKLLAGVGRHRNETFQCCKSRVSLFDRHDKFVTANHVQVRSRCRFNCARIRAESLNLCFQRLIEIPK